MFKKLLNPSFLITLVLIALIIPLTVFTVQHRTRLKSQAQELNTTLPDFISTPSKFPPTIIPFDAPQMYALNDYNIAVTAKDKDPHDVLQMTATNLPKGLTLSQCSYPTSEESSSAVTCAIVGTPTQSGTYTITLTVFDKMGNIGQLTRQLVIKSWYEKFPFIH